MNKQQSNTSNNVGVITEQGFASGVGLGFSPLKEEDANMIKNDQTDSKIKK